MSEVRPIDANALKEEIHELAIPIYGKMVLKAIDNAPTVHHPNCDICEDKAKQYSLGFQDGYLTGKERPQGEWEEPFENNGKTYHKCNRCHISSELILIDRFCPCCGAHMWKGDAE